MTLVLLMVGTNLSPAVDPTPGEVRIGLYQKVSSATLGGGKFRVEDLTTGRAETIASKDVSITSGALGISFGGKPMGKRVRVESLLQGKWLMLNKRPYRGALEFLWDSSSRLTVVNRLDVEGYVRGILVLEMSPSWPAEALQSQAVISRTYALRNRGRHGRAGFDLCAEPHCQVYRGRAAERDTTNRAVESTAGETVFYDGEILSTVFHSNCGGSTEDASNVWEGNGHPALRAVKCRWCRGNPKYFWKADLPVDDVSRRLRAGGVDVGRVKSLKVVSRSRSGRAYEVRVTGSRGRARLKGNKFRTLMNGRVVRSTLWTAVSTGRKSWRFTGRGWGHGVGLCQFGAKGMAEQGRDHRQILKHYYRRISIRKIQT